MEAAFALFYFHKFAPRSGRPCSIVSKAISTSFKFVLFGKFSALHSYAQVILVLKNNYNRRKTRVGKERESG